MSNNASYCFVFQNVCICRIIILLCFVVVVVVVYLFFDFFLSFVFLGPLPWHMDVLRLGVKFRATATGLHHSHSNARSKPHLPDPQPTE